MKPQKLPKYQPLSLDEMRVGGTDRLTIEDNVNTRVRYNGVPRSTVMRKHGISGGQYDGHLIFIIHKDYCQRTSYTSVGATLKSKSR